MKERLCTRYDHDGTPCGRVTPYADRWCRECDGYATAEPAGGVPAAAVFRFNTKRRIEDVPDQRDSMYVTHTAINHFLRHHPGHGRGEVDVQIRRLVDDMLQKRDRSVQVTQRPVTAVWALSTMQPHGYSVLLSVDGVAVLGYRTIHAERTYAQVKEGVQSRVSLKEEKRAARDLGYQLALQVVLDEVDEEAARLRALGHGHPRAAESFERQLVDLRTKPRVELEGRRRWVAKQTKTPVDSPPIGG